MYACLIVVSLLAAEPSGRWEAFRGDGTSVSNARQLPLEWNATQNVAWSIELPGYGQSSPVVRHGVVIVTAVEGEMQERLLVVGYDAKTGRQLWRHTDEASQKTKASDYVSKAAPTPAVDADGVVAFFESGDLLALDPQGGVRWKRSLVRDYGEFQGNHGVGTSVVQTEKAVLLLIDHAGPSYLAAFSKKDGKTLWKSERPSRTSWSTPLVTPDAKQLLISSNGVVEGYSTADGKRLWWLEGLKGNTVASPSRSGELTVVGSSERGESLAVRSDARGPLDETQIAWRAESASSSFGSPLVHAGRVYLVGRAGVASCLDGATGKELWNTRLGDSCWASPVGAGERIYFFLKTGETVVLRAGVDQPEQLARNEAPELGRLYGVALVDDAIFLRGGRRLVRVGK